MRNNETAVTLKNTCQVQQHEQGDYGHNHKTKRINVLLWGGKGWVEVGADHTDHGPWTMDHGFVLEKALIYSELELESGLDLVAAVISMIKSYHAHTLSALYWPMTTQWSRS